MRLQHLKQIANGLLADDPAQVEAMIVEAVERLHWQLWNGKATDAPISIERIRAVMPHLQAEQDQQRSIAPSRKLSTALQALDGSLASQSNWLVNYAVRHREGLRVAIAITEGMANFLLNRRINKHQQIAGRDAVPIFCCRSVARSTMAHSAPASDKDSIHLTINMRQQRSPLDPQTCNGPQCLTTCHRVHSIVCSWLNRRCGHATDFDPL